YRPAAPALSNEGALHQARRTIPNRARPLRRPCASQRHMSTSRCLSSRPSGPLAPPLCQHGTTVDRMPSRTPAFPLRPLLREDVQTPSRLSTHEISLKLLHPPPFSFFCTQV